MSIKAETSFSLKDDLFNPATVSMLAAALKRAYPSFDHVRYEQEAMQAFGSLELKARITFLANNLNNHLPDDFQQTLTILSKSLPPRLDPKKTDDDFGTFIWSVPSQWVAQMGCRHDRVDNSLRFLKQATMRFTVENAIRPFLREFPRETMAFVKKCATDRNYHVRRLASEGIRPYLPWAERVLVPPDEIIEVLDLLHADSTRYVTRSVANTLNDLSRDDPTLVIAALADWRGRRQQIPEELSWMARHALRTLVNKDHTEALEFLGYPTSPRFRLANVMASQSVNVGEALHWQGQLSSQENQKLRLGLRVHFLRANGEHSSKLFAMKDIEAVKGGRYELSKKVQFRPATTRTLYVGVHWVELVVNGVARGRRSFELIDLR